MKKQKNDIFSYLKDKKIPLIVLINGMIYILSQKDDLLRAYDLFFMLEFVAIIEAITILLTIAKRFLETIFHIVV